MPFACRIYLTGGLLYNCCGDRGGGRRRRRRQEAAAAAAVDAAAAATRRQGPRQRRGGAAWRRGGGGGRGGRGGGGGVAAAGGGPFRVADLNISSSANTSGIQTCWQLANMCEKAWQAVGLAVPAAVAEVMERPRWASQLPSYAPEVRAAAAVGLAAAAPAAPPRVGVKAL